MKAVKRKKFFRWLLISFLLLLVFVSVAPYILYKNQGFIAEKITKKLNEMHDGLASIRVKQHEKNIDNIDHHKLILWCLFKVLLLVIIKDIFRTLTFSVESYIVVGKSLRLIPVLTRN